MFKSYQHNQFVQCGLIRAMLPIAHVVHCIWMLKWQREHMQLRSWGLAETHRNIPYGMDAEQLSFSERLGCTGHIPCDRLNLEPPTTTLTLFQPSWLPAVGSGYQAVSSRDTTMGPQPALHLSVSWDTGLVLTLHQEDSMGWLLSLG